MKTCPLLYDMCRCQKKIRRSNQYIKCIQFICASQNYYTPSISGCITFGYVNVIGSLSVSKKMHLRHWKILNIRSNIRFDVGPILSQPNIQFLLPNILAY